MRLGKVNIGVAVLTGEIEVMATENEELVVELGFVEKAPPWKLQSKFFPSKVSCTFW